MIVTLSIWTLLSIMVALAAFWAISVTPRREAYDIPIAEWFYILLAIIAILAIQLIGTCVSR
ncbi:MAG: hypothetical protein SF069_03115 [Phycisphaerae bacterium]|nr:hypothetical protein [Phycisphaerae bacterium]